MLFLTGQEKLDIAKSKYMIFSSKKDTFTRLQINKEYLERIQVTKLLGVWIQEEVSWFRNRSVIKHILDYF